MVFRHISSAVLAVAALTPIVFAATCGSGTLCPADAPCCGQYGECGVGAFCLGGCDPLFSHSLDSCVPNPICKSGTYNLDSLDDVQSIDEYLGDASSINWQSQGKPVTYAADKSLLLTLAESTVGSLLASTHYVWYGKVCATMTTSQGKGVVTAFIMMSDARDEIDFEWVGTDIKDTQSNYYSQGVTVYTNEKNLTVGNTVEKTHEYCIDWKTDTLTWAIDGDVMRTLKRSDTWNATANRFDYPQTPSRIMLSLWPAGISTNAQGTIDWAGGLIDWDSAYMQNGYYFAQVKKVTVDCYDPPSGHLGSGKKSYRYTDKSGTNNTIELSDDLVILGSLMGTGEEPGASVSGSSSATATVAQVPGGNVGGGGEQATPVATGTTQTAADATTASATSGQGFVQGTSNEGTGSTLQPGLGKISGSAFAIVLAVLGLCVL